MLNVIHQPDCDCCDFDRSLDGAIAPSAHPEKTRLLSIALALIASFAAVEVGVGWMSHSLALMAESVHIISDCAALGIALLASWLAQRATNTRPLSAAAPSGQHRLEVWAALINGVGLLVIALWIGQEAVAHLKTPSEDILSLPMLLTAIAGLGVNTLNASLLHNHSHTDLNLRGAFLHMVADAASSVGVLLAAIAVAVWGWTWADSLTSLLVAILVFAGSVPLVRQSLVALRAKPSTSLNIDAAKQQIQQMEGVIDVNIVYPSDPALPNPLLVRITTEGLSPALCEQVQKATYDMLRSQSYASAVDVQVFSTTPPALINLSVPSQLDVLMQGGLE